MSFDRADVQLWDVVKGVNGSSMTLVWRGLDGSQMVAVALNGATTVTVSGSTIAIDFGASGITTNLNVPGVAKPTGNLSQSSYGDGYWELDVTVKDATTNVTTTTARYFSRLFGDVTGDGKVLQADVDEVVAALNQTAPTPAPGQRLTILNDDIDGSGKVDTSDRTYVALAKTKAAQLGTAPGALALQAASAAPASTEGVAPLTESQLQPLVEAAIRRWEAAGLDADGVAQLRQLTVRVVTLPDAELGRWASDVVYVNATAGRYGWFIDPTADQDEEFAVPGVQGQKYAGKTIAASGRMDLLSLLEHEMGHALGLAHVAEGDVMGATLDVGERTVVRPGDVRTLWSHPEALDWSALSAPVLGSPASPVAAPTLLDRDQISARPVSAPIDASLLSQAHDYVFAAASRGWLLPEDQPISRRRSGPKYDRSGGLRSSLQDLEDDGESFQFGR